MKTILTNLLKNQVFMFIVIMLLLIATIINLFFGDFHNLFKVYVVIGSLIIIISEYLTTQNKRIYWVYVFIAVVTIYSIISNITIDEGIGIIEMFN